MWSLEFETLRKLLTTPLTRHGDDQDIYLRLFSSPGPSALPVSLAVDKALSANEGSGKNLAALIIGINTYQDAHIPNLRGAVNDALNVERFLRLDLGTPDDHIIYLEDRSASREGILQAFKALRAIQDKTQGSAILIYFAGRGAKVMCDDDTPTAMEALVPSNCNSFFGNRTIHPILYETIFELIESLHNVLAVFDWDVSDFSPNEGQRQSFASATYRYPRKLGPRPVLETVQIDPLPLSQRLLVFLATEGRGEEVQVYQGLWRGRLTLPGPELIAVGNSSTLRDVLTDLSGRVQVREALGNKNTHSSGYSDSDHAHNHTSVKSQSESPSNSKVPSSSSAVGLALLSCSACGKAMQGPFVKALGSVFHLNCFKCMDCGEVVASKFFPIDGPNGKQHPLCERDYFRRLNLICAKCGMALRSSYIATCNKKFHVEHFTCSLCSTLFGPQDSYYEHDGDVYCHFHYSTRFATKCAGCSSAILKQFVEINRNMRDECWHPECYMINKSWNVKVAPQRSISVSATKGRTQDNPTYVKEELREHPSSLREEQERMEQTIFRIWTVLSAFEESSAACISDMLRQISDGAYLDALRMAEKFVLHVEVLFGAIEDLELDLITSNMDGTLHVREAQMLSRKTIELFVILSRTQGKDARRIGMTQELLALVTGLAHYFKILIRIALTGALKLEREQSATDVMYSFLGKFHLVVVQGANPLAKRLTAGSHGGQPNTQLHAHLGTQRVIYGYRSLAPENAGDSPFSQLTEDGSNRTKSPSSTPSDLCVKCGVAIEGDCVRLGTYQRWHSHCIQCDQCGKVATVPLPVVQSLGHSGSGSGNGSAFENGDARDTAEGGSGSHKPKLTHERRPPANVGIFVYDAGSMKETASHGDVPTIVLCTEHAHPGCRSGFQAVQRLEQYAFLLNVALRRLHLILKQQGVVPLAPDSSPGPRWNPDIVRTKPLAYPTHKVSMALHKKPSIIEQQDGPIERPSNIPDSASAKSEDFEAPTLASVPQRVEIPQTIRQQRSLQKPYIAELSAFELAIVKHGAVLMLTRSPMKDQFDLDEIVEMVETKNGGFWGEIFTGNNKKNAKQKGGVFGVPLELLVERQGTDSLLGPTGVTLRVPSLIDDIICALRQMDVSVQGLFRKGGNIRRLRELTDAIDRDPASVDLTQDKPVQLSALLRKFFRDLPDPLMTYKLHRLFIASQSLPSADDRKRYLHLISLLLPKAHRDTMEVLFVFLKWIASFAHVDPETGSKMDLSNLATIFHPIILYSRGEHVGQGEAFSGLRTVTSLLENQDEFFRLPEALWPLLDGQAQEDFSKWKELPRKEFIERLDAYMRRTLGDDPWHITLPKA